MLSSSLDTLLKMSKTTSPKKLFAYDCVTLYIKKNMFPKYITSRSCPENVTLQQDFLRRLQLSEPSNQKIEKKPAFKLFPAKPTSKQFIKSLLAQMDYIHLPGRSSSRKLYCSVRQYLFNLQW